jgi:hypothetical protein
MIKKCNKSNILKTVGLLELTGPFSSEDIDTKKTFEYYWNRKCKYNLPFNKFPIYNTKGSIKRNLELLNCLYKCGYRIFVGFSRSSILVEVLDWFKKHSDAIGISLTSTANNLSIAKNVYRMTPIDKGIMVNLEENIKINPLLSIYFIYQEGDFFSTDYLDSFKKNPEINKRLIICSFKEKITATKLTDCLINSKTTDFIINGTVDFGFLQVFNTPGYTVPPYIYDNIGSKHPEFSVTQSNNLNGRYSYFSYKGVNTSFLWRKGLEDLTNESFSPQAFDALQVQTQLSLKQNPNYLEGAAGVLQFDPVTKDRKFFSVLREDFNDKKEWILNSLIFDDPLLGDFIANKIL